MLQTIKNLFTLFYKPIPNPVYINQDKHILQYKIKYKYDNYCILELDKDYALKEYPNLNLEDVINECLFNLETYKPIAIYK